MQIIILIICIFVLSNFPFNSDIAFSFLKLLSFFIKRFYLTKKDESLISPRVKTISNMPSKSLESFKGASNKNDLLARDYNFHIVKKK